MHHKESVSGRHARPQLDIVHFVPEFRSESLWSRAKRAFLGYFGVAA
jgi:hypothetical protein